MRLTFFRINFAAAIGILALLCGMSATSTAQIHMPAIPAAQMTNAIPTNIFLTDENSLFWYRHHERLVEVKRIKTAASLPESRPANQDPEGHWGEATNGLQLSLRFEKETFTNGEPIDAIVFVRNVTNQPIVYYRPALILATKDGKFMKRKDDDGMILINMPLETTVFPQTQQKNHKQLDQVYDLTQPGEYIFQAVCNHPEVASQKVSVLIK